MTPHTRVVEGAAAAKGLRVALVVELHRQTDDVVSAGREDRGGDGRIYAAGHGDDDAHD